MEPAKRLLESLDRACAQLLPNANAAVTWRIAYAPASIERVLGCLVSAITQLWPAQNYVCHEMPQDEVTASGLAARTGCGEVPEVWRDRTAPPEIAFAVLDGSPGGDGGGAGWLVRELPAAFAISHMLYWSAGGDWAQRAEEIVAPARLSWHQLTGLGPVHDD